jgi:hypothetical protein
MEKAKKRAAWKNLDSGGNDTLTRFSSDHVIVSKASRLGVVLGSNPKQLMNSVALLKKHDLSQLESEPECLVDDLDFINDQIADLEDEDYEFENLTLGHLCGDFMEEVMDEDSDHLSCDFQTVFKKNKLRKKGKAKVRIVKKHKTYSR